MLTDEMFEEGYKFVDFDAPYVNIDAEIATQVCVKCGKTMHYEGYYKVNPDTSYRAFAVCNCGHYEEF